MTDAGLVEGERLASQQFARLLAFMDKLPRESTEVQHEAPKVKDEAPEVNPEAPEVKRELTSEVKRQAKRDPTDNEPETPIEDWFSSCSSSHATSTSASQNGSSQAFTSAS